MQQSVDQRDDLAHRPSETTQLTHNEGIPGFQALADGWGDRAPLGWNPTDARPVADAIAFLLSDLARGITGELVHVDGGYHAMGSAAAPAGEATEPQT